MQAIPLSSLINPINQMQSQPESITSEDAAYLKSREARATGVANPPADSISADAERMASINEGATKEAAPATNGGLDPQNQSQVDRAQNFEIAADKVSYGALLHFLPNFY